jgi:hypothetical protein
LQALEPTARRQTMQVSFEGMKKAGQGSFPLPATIAALRILLSTHRSPLKSENLFHFSNPIYGIIISPFEMIPTFAILLFPSASIVPCKFSNHQRITTSLVWLSIPIIQHNRSIRKRINTI